MSNIVYLYSYIVSIATSPKENMGVKYIPKKNQNTIKEKAHEAKYKPINLVDYNSSIFSFYMSP